MLEIRKVLNEEMKDALNLVWRVFLEYEAPDYTDEGIKEFKQISYYKLVREQIEISHLFTFINRRTTLCQI